MKKTCIPIFLFTTTRNFSPPSIGDLIIPHFLKYISHQQFVSSVLICSHFSLLNSIGICVLIDRQSHVLVLQIKTTPASDWFNNRATQSIGGVSQTNAFVICKINTSQFKPNLLLSPQ